LSSAVGADEVLAAGEIFVAGDSRFNDVKQLVFLFRQNYAMDEGATRRSTMQGGDLPFLGYSNARMKPVGLF
jgi:hypothetical protein